MKSKKRLEAAGWQEGDAVDFLKIDRLERLVLEARLSEQRTVAVSTAHSPAAWVGSVWLVQWLLDCLRWRDLQVFELENRFPAGIANGTIDLLGVSDDELAGFAAALQSLMSWLGEQDRRAVPHGVAESLEMLAEAVLQCVPSERRLKRTVVVVKAVDDSMATISIPAWDERRRLSLPLGWLPLQIADHVKSGYRLGALVNVEAARADCLRILDFCVILNRECA